MADQLSWLSTTLSSDIGRSFRYISKWAPLRWTELDPRQKIVAVANGITDLQENSVLAHFGSGKWDMILAMPNGHTAYFEAVACMCIAGLQRDVRHHNIYLLLLVILVHFVTLRSNKFIIKLIFRESISESQLQHSTFQRQWSPKGSGSLTPIQWRSAGIPSSRCYVNNTGISDCQS